MSLIVAADAAAMREASAAPAAEKQIGFVRDAVQLAQCWPVLEQSRHFELGFILSSAVTDLVVPSKVGELAVHHAGCWECDLETETLIWSGGVYDLFGLPRSAPISRKDATSFYSRDSLAALERVRTHAIQNGVGFTLDVKIHPAVGEDRWMRVITAPICEDDRVVRLHGIKLAI